MELAEKYGVELVFRPFIKVEGLPAREFRQQKVSIPDFSAIIFTSKTAIDHFFRLCEEIRYTVPDDLKYFCTTESIALYLQKYIVYRKRKIFFGTGSKLNDMQSLFQRHNKEKYLYCAGNTSKEEETAILDKLNINYQRGVMYRMVSNDFEPDEPFDYDMLIFFSPSGIDSLLKNFPDFKQGDIRIGCLGANTAAAVREAGLRLDMEAGTPQDPSIVAGLDRYLKAEMHTEQAAS